MLYRWETSRAAVCLDNLVPVDFTGTIQCDGYAGYGAFADRRSGEAGPILLAGCWAHVRRKFHDALEQSPRPAGWLLRQIHHLYRVEAQLRAHRAGPQLRAAVRAHQSQPIVERLKKALTRLPNLTNRQIPEVTPEAWAKAQRAAERAAAS